MKAGKIPKAPAPNADYHAPVANGVDVSVPPMFGGMGPVQTQGVKTPPLGIGGQSGRVAKPRS